MNLVINESQPLWEYLRYAEKPVVLYGMGDGALKILAVCRQYGIPIAGIFASDEFVRGHSFEGYPVESLAQIEERLGDFIVLLCFGVDYDSMLDRIAELSRRHETYAPDIPVFGSDLFTPEYFREHHIRIKILDIPTTMVELPDEQDWIFEMINNILIEVLASIAEQERITTKRRQSEGIAIAKEAGKHLGRPMIDFPPNWNQFYSDWKAGTITAVAAMRQLGLKRSTFYRLVKQQEEKHETEK